MGQPDYEMVIPDSKLTKCQIRPFRMFKRLTPKIKKTLQNLWLHILRMMENAPEVSIAQEENTLTNAMIEQSFRSRKQYVLAQVEYINTKKNT